VKSSKQFVVASCVFALSSLVGRAALAQETASEVKFKEGRAALVEGKWSVAVDAFKESLRLEPSVGTELNLALAELESGVLPLSSANHLDHVLTQLSARDARRPIAEAALAKLEPKLTRLAVTFKDPAPANVAVRIDGVLTKAATAPPGVRVEPGEHTVTVTSDETAESNTKVPCIEKTPCLAQVTLKRTSAAVAPVPSKSEASVLPTVGYATLGVGGAAVLVGSVFGVLAMGNKSDAYAGCTFEKPCPEGNRKGFQDSARSQANLSTGFFIGGAVLLAGGVAMVLLSPSSSSPTTGGTRKTLALSRDGFGLQF
jgi:hypothetical protein